ncbi:hypothetical protein Tco_0571786 [Tanacetum coccineum]
MRSVWRDLFAVSGLGRAAVVPAVLSFSAGGVSDIWWDIVGMTSMMSYWFFLKDCVVLEYCYMWLELHVDKLGQKWNDVLCLSNRYAHGVCCVLDVLLDRKQGMTSLAKCAALKERVGGWEWADMMLLYSRNAAEEDKAVPGVDAAVKTAEFLIDALWKDERRL